MIFSIGIFAKSYDSSYYVDLLEKCKNKVEIDCKIVLIQDIYYFKAEHIKRNSDIEFVFQKYKKN